MEVSYAGPRPDSPGLDQIDIALDSMLTGKCAVEVVITLDGIPANTVTVEVR